MLNNKHSYITFILIFGLNILGCAKPHKLYDETKVKKHDVVLIKPGNISTFDAGYFGPGTALDIVEIDGKALMKDGSSLCTAVIGCEVSPGKHVIIISYTWDSPEHSSSEFGAEVGLFIVSLAFSLITYGQGPLYFDVPDSACTSMLHFNALPYREYHVNVVQKDRADKPPTVIIVNVSTGETVASEDCL